MPGAKLRRAAERVARALGDPAVTRNLWHPRSGMPRAPGAPSRGSACRRAMRSVQRLAVPTRTRVPHVHQDVVRVHERDVRLGTARCHVREFLCGRGHPRCGTKRKHVPNTARDGPELVDLLLVPRSVVPDVGQVAAIGREDVVACSCRSRCSEAPGTRPGRRSRRLAWWRPVPAPGSTRGIRPPG